MCDMLQAKIDRLARKILKRNTSKSPILVDTNLGYLTLEGPGRQRLTTGQLQAYPWKVQTSYARGRWHQNWVHPSPQRFFCFEVIAAQKEVISQKSIVLRKIRGVTDQCHSASFRPRGLEPAWTHRSYSKNWANRDWVIHFLGHFWWFLRSEAQIIYLTTIFKVQVFWVILMHYITLCVIDIHIVRCLEPVYHSMTILIFGGFLVRNWQ